MKIRLASALQSDSVVDGLGIRTVIWTQGCAHACPGCHNKQTHNFDGGVEFELEDIKKEISNLVGQTGITFSGGDPLYQIEAVIELAKYIKTLNMDIWLYTGFTYEEVLKMPLGKDLLNSIDIMVDGKYELAKRSLDAPFRGSTNQRIIDCKKTVLEGKLVLVDDLMKKRNIQPLFQKPEGIFI